MSCSNIRRFGPELAASVLAAVTIVMEIAWPIAVQWGLQLAGETEPGRAAAHGSPAPGATAQET